MNWFTKRERPLSFSSLPSFVVVISLLLAGVMWLNQRPTTAVAQGRTNLVLAHYYAWFSPSSFGPGKTPFNPPAPYASTDAGTIQRHVNEARGVGIDGFVQAWYGPDASQQTEPNFRTLLDIASGSGFRAAVSFEPISAFMPNNESRAAALQTLLATHANHPAYLRMDGKPVVFFWANWALSVGDWEYIRSIADPGRSSIWIAEGGNTQYLGVFDGLYLYNIAWSPNPGGINARWAGETRAASQAYGTHKYWVATAMPGFNDSLLGRGENTIVRDRGGGSYLQNSFSGAAATSPDLLVITSYNEWPEGSNIEPSVEFGSFYLDLTRDLIATYKAGGIPAAVAPPPPPAAPAETAEETSNNNGGEGTAAQPVPPSQPQATFTPVATATPIATSTPLPDGRIVYIVQSGDTLIDIAARFDVTLDELYALNNLGPGSLINIGQEITLAQDGEIVTATAVALAAETPATPEPTATTAVLAAFPNTTVRDEDGAILYEVQEGNTSLEIALIYELTLEEFFELNELTETSFLNIGQQVIVGYVPTPEVRGGSADLPQNAPTETPRPSPTNTAVPTTPPTATPSPTPTAELAAEEGEEADTAVGSPPSPTPVPLMPTEANAGNSQFTSLLLIGIGVIVLLLASMGVLLIYLGRRQ